MRAVTGTITSSKPISLSKASAIISRFAAADIGARREVAAYLKRTANSFEDLVEFHRELRHSRKRAEAEVKQEVECGDETSSRKKKKGIDENPREDLKVEVKIEPLEGGERSKKEKKKKKKGIGQNPNENLVSEVKIESLENGERIKKKKEKKGVDQNPNENLLAEVMIESLEDGERIKKEKEKRRIDQNPRENLHAQVQIESLEDRGSIKKKKKVIDQNTSDNVHVKVKIEPLDEEELIKRREGEIVENGDGKKRKHMCVDEKVGGVIEDESKRREKRRKG